MEAKGKFIVIEGIDGCGKGTQTKFLSDFLSQNYEILNKRYPEYGYPIGDLINDWLHRKHDFSPDVQAMLYFADFIKDRELVENYTKSGKMVVSDRYLTSTIVYQYSKGVPLDRLLKLADLFELRKPDICIYIKISPETAFERKFKQKGSGNMDRHEADRVLLNKLYEGYEKMSRENVFCEWTVINGEQPIEKVSADILEVINKKLGI
jgi:dTMP kinase